MTGMTKWIGQVHQGDALQVLQQMPDASVHLAMCSPPYYGLRDYGVDGQIGLEGTLEEYLQRLVQVADELQRVLRSDGSWWLNIGDSYAGSWGNQGRRDGWAPGEQRKKTSEVKMRKGHPERNPAATSDLPDKTKMLIPHRLAIKLVDRGWVVRSDGVWTKTRPDSAADRLWTGKEYLFHFVQSREYWHDPEVLARWDVFDIPPARGVHEHIAAYPPELCEVPIRGTCPIDGVVLDPFAGAGTTCQVARDLGRQYIGIELNPTYVAVAQGRLGLDVDNPHLLTDETQAMLPGVGQ